ncbi:MAG: hypothetical protein RJA95_1031 [Verrucomicrobiota bacterium]|jgi:hypothetical protein
MFAAGLMTPANYPVSGFPLIVKALQQGQHPVLPLPTRHHGHLFYPRNQSAKAGRARIRRQPLLRDGWLSA